MCVLILNILINAYFTVLVIFYEMTKDFRRTEDPFSRVCSEQSLLGSGIIIIQKLLLPKPEELDSHFLCVAISIKKYQALVKRISRHLLRDRESVAISNYYGSCDRSGISNASN